LNQPAVVDAIVVSYFSPEDVRNSCAALRRSAGVEVRLIVVDNGSASAPRIGPDPDDIVHELGVNRGFGAACNAGLALATAPWVVLSNQDVEPDVSAVRLLIDACEDHEATGASHVVAGPALVDGGGRRKESWHRFPTPSRHVLSFLVGDGAGKIRNCAEVEEEAVVDWVSGAFLVGRRETFTLLGGFDERYFMYVEDVDLFARLRDAGGTCVWVPQASVRHDGGDRPIGADLYAHTLRNWRRFHTSRSGRLPAGIVFASAIIGSVARGLLWLGRGRRRVEAPAWGRMYLLGAVRALR